MCICIYISDVRNEMLQLLCCLQQSIYSICGACARAPASPDVLVSPPALREAERPLGYIYSSLFNGDEDINGSTTHCFKFYWISFVSKDINQFIRTI